METYMDNTDKVYLSLCSLIIISLLFVASKNYRV